jgi:hypothetical protein
MPSRSVRDLPSLSTDHIGFPGIHCLHHRFQTGTLVPTLGATDAGVFVDLPNLPSRPIRHRAQLAELVFVSCFDVLTRRWRRASLEVSPVTDDNRKLIAISRKHCR